LVFTKCFTVFFCDILIRFQDKNSNCYLKFDKKHLKTAHILLKANQFNAKFKNLTTFFKHQNQNARILFLPSGVFQLKDTSVLIPGLNEQHPHVQFTFDERLNTLNVQLLLF